MKVRFIALLLCLCIMVSFVKPCKVKAIDPVTGAFLAVSIGHLALDAYRTWKAEHPNSPDSDYNGFNPNDIVSDDYKAGGHFTDSGIFDTAYENYVSELPAQRIDKDGGLYIIVPIDDNCKLSGNKNWDSHAIFTKFDDSHCRFVSNYDGKLNFGAVNFFFTFSCNSPLSGVLQYYKQPAYSVVYISSSSTVQGSLSESSLSLERNIVSSGDSIILYSSFAPSSILPGHTYFYYRDVLNFTVDLPVLKIVPDNYFVDVSSPNTDENYNVYTRPASITGDYGIITESGDVQKIDSQTIVNEGESTVYNPVTNETHNMTDWNYDYSDRSYHITTDNGDTMTVTYGDENITIQEGSQAYNVYYLVESSGSGTVSSDGSGSGSGTGSGSSSVGGNVGVSGNVSVGGNVNVGGNIQLGVDDELKNPLSRMFSAIAGYFEKKTNSGSVDDEQGTGSGSDSPVITEDNLPAVTSAGSMSSQLQEYNNLGLSLKESYVAYTDLLSSMFVFLPDELLQLFTFGLGSVVVLAFLKRLLWRG